MFSYTFPVSNSSKRNDNKQPPISADYGNARTPRRYEITSILTLTMTDQPSQWRHIRDEPIEHLLVLIWVFISDLIDILRTTSRFCQLLGQIRQFFCLTSSSLFLTLSTVHTWHGNNETHRATLYFAKTNSQTYYETKVSNQITSTFT